GPVCPYIRSTKGFGASTIYVAILDVIGAEMPTVDERVARFTHSVLAGDDDVPLPIGEQDTLAKFSLVVTGLAAMALLAMWV
ncbi:MAG: hypothetical protein OXN89_09135, partial [Bryobacterales bacterium]|nr:hypothetical protein [Bryobacterales bacterium]